MRNSFVFGKILTPKQIPQANLRWCWVIVWLRNPFSQDLNCKTFRKCFPIAKKLVWKFNIFRQLLGSSIFSFLFILLCFSQPNFRRRSYNNQRSGIWEWISASRRKREQICRLSQHTFWAHVHRLRLLGNFYAHYNPNFTTKNCAKKRVWVCFEHCNHKYRSVSKAYLALDLYSSDSVFHNSVPGNFRFHTTGIRHWRY